MFNAFINKKAQISLRHKIAPVNLKITKKMKASKNLFDPFVANPATLCGMRTNTCIIAAIIITFASIARKMLKHF